MESWDGCGIRLYRFLIIAFSSKPYNAVRSRYSENISFLFATFPSKICSVFYIKIHTITIQVCSQRSIDMISIRLYVSVEPEKSENAKTSPSDLTAS